MSLGPSSLGTPARQVQLRVERREQIGDYIGPSGTFIPHPDPAPVGALVQVDFVDGAGALVSTVLCRVIPTPEAIRANPAIGPGMALEDVQLDAVAQSILKRTTAHSQRGDVARAGVENLGAFFDPSAEGPVIGIDLGTTYSCCAIVEQGSPRVIKSLEGYETVPSVLFINPDRKVVVGQKAVDKMQTEPGRAIYGSKRFIGRAFASREVGAYGHFFRYALTQDQRGWTAAKVGDVTVSLEVVAAAILTYIKKMAEADLKQPVRRAVITVPAYFGETQRLATARAGSLAGLSVERILSEPTAGAVAFGYGRGLKSTILVYDLGGGTFDASVLRVEGDHMQVLATDGSPFLGGSDFDDRLTEHLTALIEREHGVSIREDAVAMQRLRTAAEDAKRRLSDSDSVKIDLPYLAQTPKGPLDFSTEIRRPQLEELTRDLCDRTLSIVQQVLDRAQIKSSELDDVIMIGGQSRAPLIRRLLEERFHKSPTRKVHPDHAVALGAALVGAAALDQGVGIQLSDVLPASVRLARGAQSAVILARGRHLPAMTELEIEPDADGVYRITLLRGEAETAAGNEAIGSIQLAAAHGQRASVTVIVNAQGLLSVTAEHPETGEEQELELALIAGTAKAAPAGDQILSW